jgi:hypothetical protein
MAALKLYMVLLGCKPPGRHVEQHDFFFGIASSLRELLPAMNEFWPEAQGQMHVDGWREVTAVDGFAVSIVPRGTATASAGKLFFINLGGYLENRFEEQHYTLLTVKVDRGQAIKEAKATLFYQHNHFNKAVSHIDDKYGIDVDELYQIEDILTPTQKQQFEINLTPAENLAADELHLGYLKFSVLAAG